MYRHFAGCLEQVLAIKGWRAKRLALELGVHKSTVSRWLNAETEPQDLTELVRIAEALGVTADELLGLPGHPLNQMMALIRQLPDDMQKAELAKYENELTRLQQLVDDYRKT